MKWWKHWKIIANRRSVCSKPYIVRKQTRIPKELLKMSDFEIDFEYEKISRCQNNIRGCLRNDLRWSGKGGVRRNWKYTGCLIPLCLFLHKNWYSKSGNAVSTNTAGAQTRRSLGHHLLHPGIFRVPSTIGTRRSKFLTNALVKSQTEPKLFITSLFQNWTLI